MNHLELAKLCVVVAVVISALVLTAPVMMAQPDREGGNKLQAQKARALRSIEARLSILKAAKRCVASATTKDALHACRERQRSAMQAQRAQKKADKERMRMDKQSRQKGDGMGTGRSPRR